MSENRVDTIRIHGRYVRLGGQVYPLASISRIQTFWYEWGRQLLTPREAMRGLAGVIGAAIILPTFTTSTDAGVIIVFIIIGIVILVVARTAGRKRRFVLVIETAGAQSTALIATDEQELAWIAEKLVAAIETPPYEPQILNVSKHIQIGDNEIIYGDKIGRDSNRVFGHHGRINSR